jgi:hypothetical protein
MSLNDLLTELDVQIIEHLHATHDQQALYAISLVSGYYHALAEPFLYCNIAIDDRTEIRVKRLMMTLLDSEEGAHYVTSLTLSTP